MGKIEGISHSETSRIQRAISNWFQVTDSQLNFRISACSQHWDKQLGPAETGSPRRAPRSRKFRGLRRNADANC